MSKYRLKTLVTEHMPDLQIGTSGGGNLEIQELVPDKCLWNAQEKVIALACPWMPTIHFNSMFVKRSESYHFARPQLIYALDTDLRIRQFAPVYLEGYVISDDNVITAYPTSFIESLPPEQLTGFEEIPYAELGFKVVGLPIFYPEPIVRPVPKSSVESRSASAPSLSEMIERTRERFGLR